MFSADSTRTADSSFVFCLCSLWSRVSAADRFVPASIILLYFYDCCTVVVSSQRQQVSGVWGGGTPFARSWSVCDKRVCVLSLPELPEIAVNTALLLPY